MDEIRRTPPEWWLAQAREDLVTAEINLEAERFYAAAFFAHQVAEKSLKFTILALGQKMPYTHSLRELSSVLDLPEAILDAALDLAPEYGRAKCPYHAGGIPAQMCDSVRAQECIILARRVLDWAIDQQ
ncbi:MAG: HEPN domain-containing protein [Candidatus Coatesbacteria bacterium]|nr:HEPN domain-containing protein [Candidatus Coatesbacteria bacterium]